MLVHSFPIFLYLSTKLCLSHVEFQRIANLQISNCSELNHELLELNYL